MYMLFPCAAVRTRGVPLAVSTVTDGNGEPLATMALPFDHWYACAGTISALDLAMNSSLWAQSGRVPKCAIEAA